MVQWRKSKLEAWRGDSAPVAGKSTLNRLELSRDLATSYKKISHDPAAIEELFVDLLGRQVTVAVVVAVEEPPFLMAVQRIVGRVEVENDLLGHPCVRLEAQWRRVAGQLRPKLPKLAGFMDEAEDGRRSP